MRRTRHPDIGIATVLCDGRRQNFHPVDLILEFAQRPRLLIAGQHRRPHVLLIARVVVASGMQEYKSAVDR